jgi:hypothetical protein
LKKPDARRGRDGTDTAYTQQQLAVPALEQNGQFEGTSFSRRRKGS